MSSPPSERVRWPRSAAVFGASGGIGAALCERLAGRGCTRVYAGSRSGRAPSGEAFVPFSFELERESTLAAAAELMRNDRPELVIVASGVLTLADGTGPERSIRQLDDKVMLEILAANTVGPALVAKHMLPLFDRKERSVFAALSARVGSISDNRLGGWHSYRASKAALNMILRNLAIEMSRTHKHSVVAGLHPGTVDTALSEPFQANVPDGQLLTATEAAGKLLDVIDGFSSDDSGKVFDYRGEEIAP